MKKVQCVVAVVGVVVQPVLMQSAFAESRVRAKAKAQSTIGYTVVHTFVGDDDPAGQSSYGDLVQGSDGTLYGTNFYGGPSDFRCECTLGGTVYKMTPAGRVSVLHAFKGPDGYAPASGLTFGSDGHLYGQTSGGGQYGGGTAYRITTSGRFTRLHSFGGPANDGAQAYLGRLVLAPDGHFYGTTMRGGAANRGVAFRMTRAGAVSVLHTFSGGAEDGAFPRGQLMLASDGHLYGTALCGGANDARSGCSGIVYRLTTAGDFSVLFSFDADRSSAHGAMPQATLTESGGALHGTTTRGGAFNYGTVFRMALDGSDFATLHSFGGGIAAETANADGATPAGRLLLAADGNLYGTTSQGGTHSLVYPRGDGTIYRISPTGEYTSLHAFGADAQDGAYPLAGLMEAGNGLLYGTTGNGGPQFGGTIFSFIRPATGQLAARRH